MSLRSLALGAALLAAAPSAALAANAEVIGDSLGVGVSWASKLPSLAKLSVSIYSRQILEQIHALPRGTIAFLSLGTNDAVGGALDVKAKVDEIVAAAKEQDVKLVWMGPPCVFKPWNVYSQKLDGILHDDLAGTGVIYVSMFGDDICDRSLRGAEGVHFTMAGYNVMWHKAAAAAGFPVTTVASNEAGPPPVREVKKHKRRHRRKSAPTAPAPTTEVAPGAH
jgi:hypothetical protein